MLNDLAIEIKDLRKVYSGKGRFKVGSRSQNSTQEALRGINLSIPKGSFFGLLGSNGAGKSTIINIIAGLTIKTSGKVIICGKDIDTDPRATRFHIGVVPQELVLDPFFTVRETLEYHAGYYGIPANKRRTDEILNALKLTDKANLNSRRLSGGMKRRVLIAKALVHSPEILILDEPTAGVDVELREQLWDYVQELNRKGTTILLTTHYLEEAETLCDQIAVINHGSIIACDTKEALLDLLDEKQLTISFNQPINEIPKEIQVLGSDRVKARIEDGKTLILNYKSKQVRPDELLEFLKSSSSTIRHLSTHEPKLEDIFRHLIAES